MMRRIMALFGLMAMTFVLAARADQSTAKTDKKDNPDKKASDTKDQTLLQERLLLQQFNDFKAAVLRVKQRLEKGSAEDRDKAKALQNALDQIDKNHLDTEFSRLVQVLNNKSLKNVGDVEEAKELSKKLSAELQHLIAILKEDNRAARLRDERKRLEEMIRELEGIIKDSKIVRAKTGNKKSDKDDLAKAQKGINKRTDGLDRKLGGPGAKKADAKGEAKGPGDAKGKGKEGDSKNKGKGEAEDKNPDKKGKGKEGAEAKNKSKGKQGAESKSKGKGKEGDGKQGDGKGKEGDKNAKEGDKQGDGKGKEGSKDGKQGDGKGNKNSKGSGKEGDNKANKNNKENGKEGGSKGKGSKEGAQAKSKGSKGEGSKAGKDSKSEGKGKGKGKGEGESKPGKDSKSGDGKGSQGKGKGGGKPSKGGKAGGKSGGQSGNPSDNNNKPNDNQQPPPEETTNAQKKIQDAEQHQKNAVDKLEKDDKKNASKAEDEAIKKLEDAKKKLEELLRQAREEELERILNALENRCRQMLEMQKLVKAGTIEVDRAILANKDKKATRINQQDSGRLADKEKEIVLEATKAIDMIEAEGSAVAFAEVFKQVREDMEKVQKWLEQTKVAKNTQIVEQDIIDTLEDMIKALQKAKQDLQPPPPSDSKPQPPPPPQDQKLLDQIAELKMIRAMQIKVNKRTKMYGDEYYKKEGEQTANPELQGELKSLSDRQVKLFDVTRQIVKGDNK